MTNGTRYEEQIKVKLPDGTRQTVTVHVTPDEDVLRHISSVVGTIFKVRGQKFKVTSKYPFQIKKIGEAVVAVAEPTVVSESPSMAPPEAVAPEAAEEMVPVVPSIEPVAEAAVEEPSSPPQSERRSSSMPAVGERWKPKDPRRKASFTVLEVIPEHDLVITDDNRKIQLSRFNRYERIGTPVAQVS